MRLPHHEFFAGMPARLIKDQQDPLRWACADGLGELCQRKREHIRPHARQEQPLGLSGSRLHKTVEVEPLEAMLDGHTWPGPFAGPDPAQDRFEPNAMLIGRPQLDRGLGKCLLHCIHLLREFFFRQGKGCVGSSVVKWKHRRKESDKSKEQADETTQNVSGGSEALVSTRRA